MVKSRGRDNREGIADEWCLGGRSGEGKIWGRDGMIERILGFSKIGGEMDRVSALSQGVESQINISDSWTFRMRSRVIIKTMYHLIGWEQGCFLDASCCLSHF